MIIGRKDDGRAYVELNGLLASHTKKSVGLNAGLWSAYTNGVLGSNINVSPIYSHTHKLKNFTLEKVFPRLTKYFKCLKDISLPGINLGLFTRSWEPENSFILGLVNTISEEGKENDHISVGLINRIYDKDHRRDPRWRLGISARVSLDGIFRHKNADGGEE